MRRGYVTVDYCAREACVYGGWFWAVSDLRDAETRMQPCTRLQNELTASSEAGFKRNRNKNKLQTKTSDTKKSGIKFPLITKNHSIREGRLNADF